MSNKKKARHFSIRVIPDAENDPVQDIEQLIKAFEELPKVGLNNTPALHGRGGYHLHVECSETDRELVMNHLVSHGFRPCI